jgi:hypothetical protein
MISLRDLGWWARHVFDAPREITSGHEIEVASEMVSWPQLVETFTRVTGLPAVYVPLTVDEWMDAMPDTSRPIAIDHLRAGITSGVTTFRQNFSGFWSSWRDDVITRDMAWIRSVHPETHTLESWMRENGYTGEVKINLLKNIEDGGHALWKKEAGKAR